MTGDMRARQEQAIAALKAGDKQRARELLLTVVEADDTNEQAWLWLAGAMDDPEDQRTCLENVLHLNPANEQAQKGMDWLRRLHPALFATPSPPLPAAPAPQPSYAPPQGAPMQQQGYPPQGAPMQQPAPTMPAPAAAAPPRPAGPPALAAGELPCPRCGHPTRQSDRSCRNCKENLMQKVPREKVNRLFGTLAGVVLLLAMLGGLALSGYILFASYTKYAAIEKALKPEVADANEQINSVEDPEKKEQVRAVLMAPIDKLRSELFAAQIQPVLNLGLPMAVISLLGMAVAVAVLRSQAWAYWLAWAFALGLAGYLLVLRPLVGYAQLIEPLRLPIPPPAVEAGFALLPILLLVNLVLLGLAIPQYTQTSLRYVAFEEYSADADEHFNRGVLYRKRGWWYQAMVEWERAVRANGSDPASRQALAVSYAQLHRNQDALRELDEAIKLDPNDQSLRQTRDQIAQRATLKEKVA